MSKTIISLNVIFYPLKLLQKVMELFFRAKFWTEYTDVSGSVIFPFSSLKLLQKGMEGSPKMRNMELQDLLIQPVQRVPRYILLLKVFFLLHLSSPLLLSFPSSPFSSQNEKHRTSRIINPAR
jgi:hypothetical protein